MVDAPNLSGLEYFVAKYRLIGPLDKFDLKFVRRATSAFFLGHWTDPFLTRWTPIIGEGEARTISVHKKTPARLDATSGLALSGHVGEA
jgi:hypothetical protein